MGERMMAGAVPEVSVIIPAHNAGSLLPSCLESVFSSEGVAFEVILVNDASTDDTERIAREFSCRVISLKNNIMSANCRNLGAEHARGEILVFFDADQLMESGTLRAYVDRLKEYPEVDAIVGSLAPDTPMPGFFSKLKNFQHHFTHQTAEREGATLDSGRLAMRRRAFEEIGGFEPAFSHASIEDIALGYRMLRQGRRIRFEPTIQVTHLKSYTLGEMIRSDIFHRAIPWTGLMLRERVFRNDLNTRSSNVGSVILAWLIPPALIAGLIGWASGWWMAGAAIVLIWFLNRSFLSGCRHQFGWWFATRAALFLPLMYFYHGVGLVAGVFAYLLGASVARETKAPDADFVLLEPGSTDP